MLSNNLGDLLATMEKVRNIQGVEERDNQIIEAKQQREDDFLSQVLGLANVEESVSERHIDHGTKYSDGALQFDFDNEGHAKAIMDLAKAKGVAHGEIVPERMKNGMIRMHIMPHVFMSDKMEDVRHFIGLGLPQDQVESFDGMVQELSEREANPNHDADTGKFTSLARIKSDGKGSRSLQFSAPDDGLKKRTRKDNERQGNPVQRRRNRQFTVLRKKPCGRAARPSFRKAKGMSKLKYAQTYVRCHDGKKPEWARNIGRNESRSIISAYSAVKEHLASVLRENLAKKG